MKRALVWFRQDLRLHDNPALHAACQECDEVYPVFIDDRAEHSDTPITQSTTALGGASRVWLHHSLARLQSDFSQHNTRLLFQQGAALSCLEQLIAQTNATHLYWNRCYEPEVRQRDEYIKRTLKPQITVKSYNGSLLLEPWEQLKQDGTPYRVFTPYWKALIKNYPNTPPLPQPNDLKAATQMPDSLTLEQLQLLPHAPTPRWDKNLIAHWQIGEDAAHDKFLAFLDNGVQDYASQRDFPARNGTTTLSAHLHFGEISPRQLFHYGNHHQAQHLNASEAVSSILRQVVWREFAHYLLYHFPQTVAAPLYDKYTHFEWLNQPSDLQRWQQGMTGIPIIDAGMRQLYATGYMHNRVRMIAASFLCKNLLVHWREGEAWFRETLIDADLANNVMGWQWVAGCGADAAPYFRIFNPVLQSEKFDKQGDYIRHWVPELNGVNAKDIHQPSPEVAAQCDYPEAMVDLKATRQRALDRFAEMKAKAAN